MHTTELGRLAPGRAWRSVCPFCGAADLIVAVVDGLEVTSTEHKDGCEGVEE